MPLYRVVQTITTTTYAHDEDGAYENAQRAVRTDPTLARLESLHDVSAVIEEGS